MNYLVMQIHREILLIFKDYANIIKLIEMFKAYFNTSQFEPEGAQKVHSITHRLLKIFHLIFQLRKSGATDSSIPYEIITSLTVFIIELINEVTSEIFTLVAKDIANL